MIPQIDIEIYKRLSHHNERDINELENELRKSLIPHVRYSFVQILKVMMDERLGDQGKIRGVNNWIRSIEMLNLCPITNIGLL